MDTMAKRDELARVVERDRQALVSAFAQVEVAAKRSVDVRRWVARRPWRSVLGGCLVGYWLGRKLF